MQSQERAKAKVETSIRQSQLNATQVLNHMHAFSRDFRRPSSSTTTLQTCPTISPIEYDAEYTVVHDPPQLIGDGRKLRKTKATPEQLQSQKELSDIIRQVSIIADRLMKIDWGISGLRFDMGGSTPLIKQIAAGHRIASRFYTHK